LFYLIPVLIYQKIPFVLCMTILLFAMFSLLN
jgi:hypothetical protein